MPYLQLVTNVSKKLITDEFAENFRSTLAKSMGEQHVMLYIESGIAGVKFICFLSFETNRNTFDIKCLNEEQMISFSGNEPCAFVTVMALKGLGVEENKKHSAAISSALEKIGIPFDRNFICFIENEPYQIGHKGTTFEELLKKT